MCRSRSLVIWVLTVGLAVAGCSGAEVGSPQEERRDAAAADATEPAGATASDDSVSSEDSASSQDSGSSEPVPESSQPEGGSDSEDPPPSLRSSGDADPTPPPAPQPAPSPTSSPTPAMPAHDDFPMTASLDRQCVHRGGQLTITVETDPDTGVGYHAVYNGDEGGAEPPYGEGHGGNGGDMTDDEGRFQETWVVGPSAPVGPARVDVVAGRGGEFATTVLRFEVVDAVQDGCDGG